MYRWYIPVFAPAVLRSTLLSGRNSVRFLASHINDAGSQILELVPKWKNLRYVFCRSYKGARVRASAQLQSLRVLSHFVLAINVQRKKENSLAIWTKTGVSRPLCAQDACLAFPLIIRANGNKTVQLESSWWIWFHCRMWTWVSWMRKTWMCCLKNMVKLCWLMASPGLWHQMLMMMLKP